ncbi:MAG: hypothetical protein SYNGOMJ08_00497 [Candidatus Syntrophoarchaeum sp. GoM_oil]|nr:MAG: hypothetical protein SYNGOMJ08_00497 [Candidatus Syntrophoarchaeum sp. GoM_oil]
MKKFVTIAFGIVLVMLVVAVGSASLTTPTIDLTPNQSISSPEDKKELFVNGTTVKPPALPPQKAPNIISSAQKDPKETPEPIDGSRFITSMVIISPTMETVHGALPLLNKSKKRGE